MTLTYEDKMLINTTFHKILTSDVADSFYDHLFETSPELKPLFEHSDMRQQRKMFIDMIRFVVYSIDNVDKIRSSISKLGQRHIGYGVSVEDYAKISEAFLWILSQKLGDSYTDDVANAWGTTFQLIVDVAINEHQK